jgi:hypothetical protein
MVSKTEKPEGLHSFTLHLTESILDEANQLSRSLGASLDQVVQLAWELGKSHLYKRLEGSDAALGEPPAMRLPTGFNPEQIRAATPPDLPEAAAKHHLTAQVPSRMIDEIQDLATSTDRSPSWIFQSAYVDARPGLFGLGG